MGRMAARAASGWLGRPASGSFMARRKSSVMASMLRCTPSWLLVMAATRAAAMWPAVLIGSTGWPERWGAGVGVVFVSASCGGALLVQAVASRKIASCGREVSRESEGPDVKLLDVAGTLK